MNKLILFLFIFIYGNVLSQSKITIKSNTQFASGFNMWVPNWNSPSYLSRYAALMTAPTGQASGTSVLEIRTP